MPEHLLAMEGKKGFTENRRDRFSHHVFSPWGKNDKNGKDSPSPVFPDRSGQSVPDPFPQVCPQQTGQDSVFLVKRRRPERDKHEGAELAPY